MIKQKRPVRRSAMRFALQNTQNERLFLSGQAVEWLRSQRAWINADGFMLIEVIFATLISAMVGTALFVCLNQINKYVILEENFADIYSKAAIVHRQLERDLSGFFIPIAAEKQQDEKKIPEPTQNTQQLQAQNQKNVGKKEEQIKHISKVFYAKNNKDKNLELLTFITNNPMQVYWSDKAGKAKPKIARVVYRLMKEKDSKNSYKLLRQESYDLYFDAYKSGGTKEIREYEMIDGIKNLTINYAVLKEQEQEQEKKEDKKEKKKEYTKLKEWKEKADKNENGANTDQKKKEKQKKRFPEYVIVTMVLWDNQKKQDTKLVFNIPLTAQGQQPPEPQDSIAARLLEQTKIQQNQQQQADQPAAPTTASTVVQSASTQPLSQNTGAAAIPMSVDTLETAIKTGDMAMLDTLSDFDFVVPADVRIIRHE